VDLRHDNPGGLVPVHRRIYELLTGGGAEECAALLAPASARFGNKIDCRDGSANRKGGCSVVLQRSWGTWSANAKQNQPKASLPAFHRSTAAAVRSRAYARCIRKLYLSSSWFAQGSGDSSLATRGRRKTAGWRPELNSADEIAFCQPCAPR